MKSDWTTDEIMKEMAKYPKGTKVIFSFVTGLGHTIGTPQFTYHGIDPSCPSPNIQLDKSSDVKMLFVPLAYWFGKVLLDQKGDSDEEKILNDCRYLDPTLLDGNDPGDCC